MVTFVVTFVVAVAALLLAVWAVVQDLRTCRDSQRAFDRVTAALESRDDRLSALEEELARLRCAVYNLAQGHRVEFHEIEFLPTTHGERPEVRNVEEQP